MRLRIAAGMALISAGLAAPCGAGERPNVIREVMTIQSHRMMIDQAHAKQHGHKRVSRLMPVSVAVYRPNDGLKHPAVVYLHGGGMSFADPLMDAFHVQLASRGLVVLAPHYLLDGTGWTHWHESAVNTVSLAASLPSVDADQIGMSGLSMGGQIGLSTAARDPRIKKVAEYFTAWPGTLPDEPIDKLPPVLLLNGTADPIIPFDKAMVLDTILEHHKLPFERHVYEGLGHGFGTPAAFHDGVRRATAFFGGNVDLPTPHPGVLEPFSTAEGGFTTNDPSGSAEDSLDPGDALFSWPTVVNPLVPRSVKKKRPRLTIKPAQGIRAGAILPRRAQP